MFKIGPGKAFFTPKNGKTISLDDDEKSLKTFNLIASDDPRKQKRGVNQHAKQSAKNRAARRVS